MFTFTGKTYSLQYQRDHKGESFQTLLILSSSTSLVWLKKYEPHICWFLQLNEWKVNCHTKSRILTLPSLLLCSQSELFSYAPSVPIAISRSPSSFCWEIGLSSLSSFAPRKGNFVRTWWVKMVVKWRRGNLIYKIYLLLFIKRKFLN